MIKNSSRNDPFLKLKEESVKLKLDAKKGVPKTKSEALLAAFDKSVALAQKVDSRISNSIKY